MPTTHFSISWLQNTKVKRALLLTLISYYLHSTAESFVLTGLSPSSSVLFPRPSQKAIGCREQRSICPSPSAYQHLPSQSWSILKSSEDPLPEGRSDAKARMGQGTQERPGQRQRFSRNNNYRNNDRTGYRTNNRIGGGRSRLNEFGFFNKEITEQETAQDLLNLLASRKGALGKVAGGGTMSTVNFSTSVHRVAKHVSRYQSRDEEGNNRARILSDPRFALLICSTAEAMLDGAEVIKGVRKPFGARELSNVAWAIAKLNIAPPDTAMAVDTDKAEDFLREKSKEVRSTIFDIAKKKAAGEASPSGPSSWIPALSQLCGLIIDAAGLKSLNLDPRQFQQQELSNLMWALTTAKRPDERVFDFVVESIVLSSQSKNNRKEQMLMPQEWSIPLYCLAKTGISSGREEVLLPFVKELMDNEPGFLERFKPQELSNTVWAAASILSKRPQEAKGPASDAALGILRHASRELIRRNGEGYKSQELTNTMWAMATLGFGISAEQNSKGCHLTHSYTFLPSDDPDGDRALMEEALKLTLASMKRNLRLFSMQELNNMCWVMARLDEKDEELLEMIGNQLANPRRKITSQDLSTSIWSMATMEYFNDDLYRALVTRLHSIGPEKFKPQELSNTLWALATAGVTPTHLNAFDIKLLPDDVRPTIEDIENDPVTACFMAGADELMRRPEEFKTQEIKDTLWSFSKVGLRHPELFRTVAEHLVGKDDDPRMSGRGMRNFNAQGVSNLSYAFARQAQLGAENFRKYGKKSRIPLAGGRLAYYMVSFLDIGEGLLRKLFLEIAGTALEVHDDLSKFSTQDMANTVWAFAILGLKHDTFLTAVSETLQKRIERCLYARRKNPQAQLQGQEIANTIWALGSLNFTPGGLLSTVEAYLTDVFKRDEMTTHKIAGIFTRQELSNLAWAIAVFGEYPEKLIDVVYMGVLGVGDKPDPYYVQKCHGDDGIDQTHINSLLYLQIMLDLDVGRDRNPFSLPDGFPVAWTDKLAYSASKDHSSSSFSSDDNSMMNNDGCMEINTSKTQATVSKALNRIGFGHVDEFTHTMEDLAVDYGINIPAYPIQLLSLDMADHGVKIGIEVDGPGHFVSNIDGRSEDDPERDILTDVGHYYVMNKEGMYGYKFEWSSQFQVMNGSTSLKLRMFQKLGWRLLRIPFWEWTPVEGDLEMEDEYCQTLLGQK